jgi:hypothetical protein
MMSIPFTSGLPPPHTGDTVINAIAVRAIIVFLSIVPLLNNRKCPRIKKLTTEDTGVAYLRYDGVLIRKSSLPP